MKDTCLSARILDSQARRRRSEIACSAALQRTNRQARTGCARLAQTPKLKHASGSLTAQQTLAFTMISSESKHVHACDVHSKQDATDMHTIVLLLGNALTVRHRSSGFPGCDRHASQA
jgi:hypothetical protein